MAKKEDKNLSPRIVNRKATHEYHILDRLEAGVKLMGSEVQSIRRGQVSLAEGFARIEPDGRLMLYQVDIGPYPHAGKYNHEPKRDRVLLAHRREIEKFDAHVQAKNGTLVPLALYFVHGRVKVEIGVAVGKRDFDKRQDMKDRDADRALRRAMTRKTL